MPLGSQQSLPAMGQAQPKFSIVFVVRCRGEFSALLDLILEEVGCFEHCNHHNKSPAHRGFDKPKTQQLGICSEESKDDAAQPIAAQGFQIPRFTGNCRAESLQSPVGLAGRRTVYLRLTIQAYGSAYGCRRSAPALPVLRLADAIAAHARKGQPGFRPSQL